VNRENARNSWHFLSCRIVASAQIKNLFDDSGADLAKAATVLEPFGTF
jgi:hypothetical protein